MGHGAETAYPFVKMEEAEWFFRDNKNIGEKYLFLKKNKIAYLFFGPEERALGFNPENADYLKRVYPPTNTHEGNNNLLSPQIGGRFTKTAKWRFIR